MSDEITATDVETEAPETEEGPPSRVAGAVVALILAGAVVIGVRAILLAFPYVAYFVTGVIVTVAVQRAAGWARKRRSDDEVPEEQEPPDVGEALRTLGEGGHHVLLTTLLKPLGAADTKAVRALLKAAGVRVRSGVRAPTGNGPGVHHEDIPPAPSVESEEHGDGCCCRSANNTNANNGDEDPSQKGLSVEAIGQAGTLIRDHAETQERRSQVSDLVDRLFDAAKQKQTKS
jgi:hypothetical protein